MSGARAARPSDARAIAHVEVETWRTTYAGTLTDRLLLGMSVERQTRLWTSELRHGPGSVWVWEEKPGGVVGFGSCGRLRSPFVGYDGEIYMLYVLPDAQGAGIGRQLLRALFASLVAAGSHSCLVWVVRANPARFFYERLGARLVLQRRIAIGGESVECLGYGWDDLCAALLRCGWRPEAPP